METEVIITRAVANDLSFLAEIELAAATLLRGHAPDSVLIETTSASDLQAAQVNGLLWVARRRDVPIGFAHLKVLEPGVVHLDEIDVHPDHGRRGVGTRLIRSIIAWAAENKYRYITLSTFRNVPWNMPFYTKLGFSPVPCEELSSALTSVIANETRRGLDLAKRVVMRFTIEETRAR
jgi:GNAT superfamily N-acetyltransferase